MKKQTAVEWLVQWAKENPVVYQKDYDAAIEWAKAMEKEQMINAYRAGRKDEDMAYYDAFFERTYEDYYRETYGGDK